MFWQSQIGKQLVMCIVCCIIMTIYDTLCVMVNIVLMGL